VELPYLHLPSPKLCLSQSLREHNQAVNYCCSYYKNCKSLQLMCSDKAKQLFDTVVISK
jgi:hypothetical protein